MGRAPGSARRRWRGPGQAGKPRGAQDDVEVVKQAFAIAKSILQGTFHGCSSCNRSFKDANALIQHMQVHQPRDVRCPVCGEQRFRNGANVAQHVESGSCSGCRGKKNARKQIYNFMRFNASTRQFLDQKLIGNGSCKSDAVPEKPYGCQRCGKAFKQVSQLMQHQMASHPGASLPQLGM